MNLSTTAGHRAATSLAALSVAVLLAACASPSPELAATAAPVETRTPVAAASTPAPAGGGAAAAGTAQSQVSTVDLASRGMGSGAAAGGAALLAAPAERIVYFDFDSFAVRDEFRPLLEGHARVLVRDGGKRITVEGHTDDRGGREYNLALGQKRAESVARTLVLLGVADRQVEAVSFGEERPAMAGASEQAWARNRRAELKDQ